MIEFTVSIAGYAFSVRPLFPEIKDFFSDYLSDDEPLFTVTSLPQDIPAERERTVRQAELEGRAPAGYSDRYIETISLCRRITAALLDKGVLLFHGAAVAYGGRAYVFTAPSGTGKTTHVRLWLDNIPGCHVLNGDKPFLRFDENGVFVCGTPWMGKERMGVNEILPLAGICILQRSEENCIDPLEFKDAFPTVLSQTSRPEGGSALVSVVRLLKKLEDIPCYRLGCNMQPDAARVSFEAMVR